MEDVLKLFGASPDQHDKHRWHSPRGPVSINGKKFWFWNHARGGGGAIDLSMALLESDFATARQYLATHFAGFETELKSSVSYSVPSACFCLPKRNDSALPRVIDYLNHQRGLPTKLLYGLIHGGNLFADRYDNCVFVLLGKEKLPVGAELRSTSKNTWRGMCPGSKKNRGFFYVGDPACGTCVLCESAIDAISCHAMGISPLCISTSGATPRPSHLPALLGRGFKVFCGFDNDAVGNGIADQLICEYPEVSRLSPINKDWNDDLLKG